MSDVYVFDPKAHTFFTTDIVEFIRANIDDPELAETLNAMRDGNVVIIGGGAQEEVHVIWPR